MHSITSSLENVYMLATVWRPSDMAPYKKRCLLYLDAKSVNRNDVISSFRTATLKSRCRMTQRRDWTCGSLIMATAIALVRGDTGPSWDSDPGLEKACLVMRSTQPNVPTVQRLLCFQAAPGDPGSILTPSWNQPSSLLEKFRHDRSSDTGPAFMFDHHQWHSDKIFMFP